MGIEKVRITQNGFGWLRQKTKQLMQLSRPRWVCEVPREAQQRPHEAGHVQGDRMGLAEGFNFVVQRVQCSDEVARISAALIDQSDLVDCMIGTKTGG